MRKTFLAVNIFLFLTVAARAQNNLTDLRHLRNYGEEPQSATQSGDLAEAEKLSAAVVKLYGEGKYAEALTLAKRALEIRERAHGAEHQLIVPALLDYAELHSAIRKFEEAESLFKRALTIYEKTLGANDPKVSGVLERLALVNYALGNYDKSENLYSRALSIKEKAFGAEHLQVAATLSKIAEFYHLRREYGKAEAAYLRLLSIREKLLGANHNEVGETLDRYACLLRKSRTKDEAKIEEIEERANLILYQDNLSSSFILIKPEVLNGKAVSLPKPQYPVAAKRARLSGTVPVKVTIDETGKVIRACAISEHQLFIDSTERAAYQARFSPTLREGKPIKVVGIITYRFVAQ